MPLARRVILRLARYVSEIDRRGWGDTGDDANAASLSTQPAHTGGSRCTRDRRMSVSRGRDRRWPAKRRRRGQRGGARLRRRGPYLAAIGQIPDSITGVYHHQVRIYENLSPP